jgi:hypothetical protein
VTLNAFGAAGTIGILYQAQMTDDDNDYGTIDGIRIKPKY